VPIHVIIITIINIILHCCAQIDSDEKRWGDNSTRKGKRGWDLSLREYFIIFMEKCNLWIFIYPKFTREGVGHQVA
jgi:hypothetical protein